jgi:hypothetical protein
MCWPAIGAIAPAVIGGIGLLTGDSGDSSETTTQNVNYPGFAMPGVQKIWDEFMNTLYPPDTAAAGNTLKGSLYQQFLTGKNTSPSQGEKVYNWATNSWDYAPNASTAGTTHGYAPGEAPRQTTPELDSFMQRNNLTWDSTPEEVANALNSDVTLNPVTDPNAPAGPKSYQDMLIEDTGFQKDAYDKYIAGAQDATKPYTDVLADLMEQSRSGTGFYTPTKWRFGTGPVNSFLPKTALAQANQYAGFQQGATDVNVGLLKDILAGALKYTPNAAQRSYFDDLLLKLAPDLIKNYGATQTSNTSESGDSLTEGLGLALGLSNALKNVNWNSSTPKTDPGIISNV